MLRLTETRIREIYETYFKKVYNYISYRINNHSDVEDLVSQVFLKVIKSESTYNEQKGNLDAWIIGIAKNTVFDYLNQGRKIQQSDLTLYDNTLIDPSDQPETVHVKKEENRNLMTALNQLAPRERHIIALKYGADLTNADIAKVMVMSRSNVGVILYRSLRKLRNIMEEKTDE